VLLEHENDEQDNDQIRPRQIHKAREQAHITTKIRLPAKVAR
jgi:hypothetical protein